MQSTKLGLITALLFSWSVGIANADYRELSKRIPDGANVVFFIDVKGLQNSPLGKSENWRLEMENAYNAGLELVPPYAEEFIAAIKLDLGTKQTEYQVGLMEVAYDVPIPQLAVSYGGSTDRISGRSVAVLPGSTYVIKFMDNIYGFGFPAKRQDAARWITRYYDNSLRGLSPYLMEAEEFAKAGAPIIVALDLNHAISPEIIKDRLQHLESLKGQKYDADDWAKKLASIRGVSLGVTVQQDMVGAIKVDFSEDISEIGTLAKPILLEVLGRNGMMIDEFESWDVTVTANRVQLTGPLYSSGMRRIFSLVEPPPEIYQTQQKMKEEGKTATKQDLMRESSLVYFKTITSLLDDLRQQKKERKTMGQLSVWFDKYARKIDRLPILNVDPALINYGQWVSQSLRGGQAQVINAAAEKTLAQQDVQNQYYGGSGFAYSNGYGWGGWYNQGRPDWEGTLNEKAKVRRAANIKGGNAANDVMRSLDNATFQIRREMSAKYGAEF